VKITHIRTSHLCEGEDDERRVRTTLEHVSGVAGVASIRSMGLTSVLYDEYTTDPARISDDLLFALQTSLLAESAADAAQGYVARTSASRTFDAYAVPIGGVHR